MKGRTEASRELSVNALEVLAKRYLMRDSVGQVIESPEQLFERVAVTVATPEGRKRRYWSAKYREMMVQLRFLPNSPTLMNAGKKQGQLSACFVLPVEDSLEGIFGSLKDAALIHQSGGGTGFSFSRLRAEGSFVRSSQGVASGPVSFMKIFDTTTETIKQGGTRRGANMGILRVDHPDVLNFVHSKKDQRSVINFNISVGITDEFMRAVDTDTGFFLKDPRTGVPLKKIGALQLFKEICQSAWECGDPGMVFLDRMNLFNPTPIEGVFESTNPCGEQPLLPYESCNLGSLNLSRYLSDRGEMNWELLREDVWCAVRFLDAVIDVNQYPVEASRKITLRNRKIGLGVMGFADALLQLRVPFDSGDALIWGERWMSFIDREAKRASAALAKEKGAFPNWKGSLWERLGYSPLRNATVSTVAPTGTISIIAGASSGIEPIFSAGYYRNVLDGARLLEVHPAVVRALGKTRAEELDLTTLDEEEIRRRVGPAWRPARDVSCESHIRVQSVFQRHSDSAVSKTVNLPESATVEEIEGAFRLAFRLGCKGITVYRDRSRSAQVLEAPLNPNAENAGARGIVCPTC